MHPRVRLAVRTGLVFGLGALALGSVADEGRPVAGPTGSLIRYDVAGGDGYFALSLRAPALGTPAAHDHVLLVDTSASQTGAHREQALEVLEACLAALPAGDRVKLVAVDVEVKSLSDDFHAPAATQTQAALAQLKRRVPLGATGLEAALNDSLSMFSGDRARSIIYIGDGMSTGKLIDVAALQQLVDKLRERHVAVHSYAVGPRTDLQLLGLLATHTGGYILVDEVIDDRKTSAASLGRELAQAADAPVFYADSLEITPEVTRILPGAVPPLRADRDSVVLGLGSIGETVDVKAVSTDSNRTLTWTVIPSPPQAGNTFLAGLWSVADRSQGLCVSVAGREMLNIARQEYEDYVQQLVGRGQLAVAARDLKQAEQIAWAVREIDPANVEAEAILTASHKVKAQTVQFAPPAPAQDSGTVKDDDLLEAYEADKVVATERLTQQVKQDIEATRKLATQDPDSALANLKRTLNTVNSSINIDPVSRESLRRRLQAALDAMTTQKQRRDIEEVQQQVRFSAMQARILAVDELVQKEEELEQLIDKVRSLLDEGFTGNEAAFERSEAVARAAWETAPYLGVTAAAIFDTEAAGQLDKIQRMRYLRSDKFLETLYQVERSHVPFPDEPPILWPAPETWRALTERRKKWSAVDLKKYNAAEEKIRRTLDKTTEFDFDETPLEEVIKYLKDYHNINIIIDRPGLLDAGTLIDAPVTLKLAGISFRSALKLLLEPFSLTYVIEDEVMKIVTAAYASDRTSTRVYPVADLVIPITSGQAGGLGQGGGGAGGIGGGQGGGQFGGGGGGQGGGGMGGGGMFNVADETQSDAKAPAPISKGQFNNKSVRERKKKRATLQ